MLMIVGYYSKTDWTRCLNNGISVVRHCCIWYMELRCWDDWENNGFWQCSECKFNCYGQGYLFRFY